MPGLASAEAIPYRGKDGDMKSSKTAAVSDGETVVKVVSYDPAKFKYFKAGQSIVLREIIRKNDQKRSIVVTKNSKIFMTAPLEIPEDQKALGTLIINPLPAKTITVKEAFGSAAKKKVSVTGRIIQDEETRTVNVRREDVSIKTIIIEDESDRAKVTLWRECTKNNNLRPGDNILITGVVINVYNNCTTLQPTMLSTLKKSEEPELVKNVLVDAISLEDCIADLLLVDETTIACKAELLQAALATPTYMMPDVEMATPHGPIDLHLTCKGKEVISVLKYESLTSSIC